MLARLVLWTGMLCERRGLPRILDLAAATGLRCGLVATVDGLSQAGPSDLARLTVPPEHGGLLGRVEPLLAGTGRGVCVEGAMPVGELGRLLAGARRDIARVLPAGLVPRGWWPLMDAPPPDAGRTDGWRSLADAVRGAGLGWMWTKTLFGDPVPALADGAFVALPFTAGDWDGWSPFPTLRSVHQLQAAERRLLRTGRPGWLASTVDPLLWMLPGDVLETHRALHRLARLVAGGGASGRLVNVTPSVVARYARILAGGAVS